MTTLTSEPRITIVVAAGRNWVIGRDNALPWKLPTDLKHFRRLTLGKPIIMGRRTFQSIGRPLDGRTNIVISRDAEFSPIGAVVVHSLDEALATGRAVAKRDGVDAVMVTGGAQIYAEALALADRVELTEVDLAPSGDALFPPLSIRQWREVSRTLGERGPPDEANFSFVTYEKITRS